MDSVPFYERNAKRFAVDTGELDVSSLYQRFLARLPPGGRILDAGCGVGRDTLAFAERGFAVTAFDGSAEMVRLTTERVGGRVAAVRQLRFEDVAWCAEFDGIWACASLLHVPSSEFPDIVSRLAAALRPDGVCYMSFKHGSGERIVEGRLFSDHTKKSLRAALRTTEFALSEAWLTDDVRPGRSGQRWLNAIAAVTHHDG